MSLGVGLGFALVGFPTEAMSTPFPSAVGITAMSSGRSLANLIRSWMLVIFGSVIAPEIRPWTIQFNALARIHRRTVLGTALEEARGCSSESGIMVL